MNWQKKIDTALIIRQKDALWRVRTVVENGVGPFLRFKNRLYLNFSSNDYLGLSRHPLVVHAWKENAERFGVGSGGSGHVNGYTIAHQQLEETLSEWLGYPRALLFISGFSANQAVITALMKKGDCIIADRFSHASLLEAANLSPAKLYRFNHNNITSLQKFLNRDCNGERLVVTEGIFSMDGDNAPLKDIYSIVKKQNAWLLVDDAHGIGVSGDFGTGSCNVQGVKPELLIITFGKSIGVSGAAILCSDKVAQYLLQFSRHLIYSTSMPPAQAMAIQAAIKIIQSDAGEQLRNNLKKHIQIFREEARNFCQLTESYSPIQPFIIGDNDHAIYISELLRDAGIWTVAIRAPTVPQGTARIRLTLTAAHKPQDITMLLEVLNAICK